MRESLGSSEALGLFVEPADGESAAYAPAGTDCGTVVEIEDRRQVDDADRYPTTADGDFCSLDPSDTRTFTREVALCARHVDDWGLPVPDG